MLQNLFIGPPFVRDGSLAGIQSITNLFGGPILLTPYSGQE